MPGEGASGRHTQPRARGGAGTDPGVAEDEAEEDEVLDEERLPAARAALPAALRAADAGGRGAGPAAPRRM